jgi:hypothetical protein
VSLFTDGVPTGTTIRGAWGREITNQISSDWMFVVALPVPASASLTDGAVNGESSVAVYGPARDADCTGSAEQPTAPRGKVCIYIATSSNVGNVVGKAGLGRYGFIIRADLLGSDPSIAGTWAYTAP